MRKVAGFLGSTGLAVLMTAAGLVIDVAWLTITGLALLALSALLFIISKLREEKVSDEPQDEMGDDNTYVNASPPKKAGSRNTVVGPTHGTNALFRTGGISIGANAGYDPKGTFIGSGAGGGLRKKKPNEPEQDTSQ